MSSASDSRSTDWNCTPTRPVSWNSAASQRRTEGGTDGASPRRSTSSASRTLAGKTRRGRFTVLRLTMRKRLRAKLKEINTTLRLRWHDPVPEVGQWLGSIIRGHANYYGVPLNSRALQVFRKQVTRLWKRALSRRSQKGGVTWARIYRLAKRWLPPVRIVHPYPEARLCLLT